MHFKYLNKLYLQCIICYANVLSTESVENYLTLHSEQQQQKKYVYQNW